MFFFGTQAGLETDSDSDEESAVYEYRQLLQSKYIDQRISGEDHRELEALREKLQIPTASRDYVLAEVQAQNAWRTQAYVDVVNDDIGTVFDSLASSSS